MAVDHLRSIYPRYWAPWFWMARVGFKGGLIVPLCFLAAVVITLIISWHFLPYSIDDALIGYRYSERLLDGKGLTWNDAERVEGYSNLLWLLVVALGGLIQPNLVLVGWCIGAIATVVTLASVPWAFGRGPHGSVAAVITGLVIMACSEAFAFWAVAGMETVLVSALLSWALATAYRQPDDKVAGSEWVMSVLFGLLSVTRADGILFAICTAVGELFRSGVTRNSVRRVLRLLGAPVVFIGAQLVFRFSYYGTLVPNTAFGKLVFNPERMLGGLWYVVRGAIVNGALLATIAVAIVALPKLQRVKALRQQATFIVPGVTWLAYVCAIGGDWFPFERHWQPAFICFVFLASGLVSMLPVMRPSVTVLLTACLIVFHIAAQASVNPYLEQYPQMGKFMENLQTEVRSADPSGRAEQALLSRRIPSREESLHDYQYEYQKCIAIGGLLNIAFREKQPLVAVNAAGCLPYFSRLPALDMLGLNDVHIARHRPPDMGYGPLAHELGDGAYVLSRHPDLIVFCGNGEMFGVVVPCLRSDREIATSPNFKTHYRLVFYRNGPFEMPVWTRVEKSRLGITRTEDTIYIPGFLLATTPEARAELDSGGHLVARIYHNGSALLSDIEFPPGTWELSLQADPGSELRLAVRPADGSVELGPNSVLLRSSGGVRSFEVIGPNGTIYAITTRRVGGK